MSALEIHGLLEDDSGAQASRMRVSVLLIAVWLTFCGAAGAFAAASQKTDGPRVVHVVVALCDNVHQGVVPVPWAIGNGQDPGKNLYWGAAYGVKTFLSRQPEWMLHARISDPAPHVLERLVFQLK